MRVLVYEPDNAGHHLNYVRLLLDGLRAVPGLSDVRVVLSHDAETTIDFAAYLADVQGVTICPSVPPLTHSALRAGLEKLEGLRQAVREFRPDHVFIPYGDGLAQLLGVRRATGSRTFPRGTEAETLMMRGTFAYTDDGSLRSRARRAFWRTSLAAAPLSVVHLLDPFPYDAIQRHGGRLAARTRLMADPVDPLEQLSHLEARRRLGIPVDGRYLGSSGLLNAEKGIDRLLAAFASATLKPDDRLLLVGRVNPVVQAEIDRRYTGLIRSGRLVVIDGFADRPRMEASIAACDVFCTVYPRHIGSASFAIRAAAAGRPVLGSTFGWVGRIVPMMGLGTTCDVNDPAALTRAVTHALDASATYVPGEAAKRFVRFHTVANFQAQWTRRLKERLGQPPSDELVEWDWVMSAAAAEG